MKCLSKVERCVHARFVSRGANCLEGSKSSKLTCHGAGCLLAQLPMFEYMFKPFTRSLSCLQCAHKRLMHGHTHSRGA